MRLRGFALTLTCLCFLATAAFGQTVNVTTGGINGKVVDSTGGGLPGVTVTVTNVDTGAVRRLVTEPDGSYTIKLLQPGRYSVEAELTGLGKASVTNVNVLLGNSTLVDLTIAPQRSEAVTVTAASPVIDTTRTGTAVSVTSEQIANLPIIGRDFRSLALLTPGISDAFGGRITANGARGIATDFNIDGASANNDFFGENTGGTRAPFTFSQAAIREFQVIRSQYDSEYGRGVGAQVNAITKSGTNVFSGEAFLFYRDRSWASTRSLTLANGQTVTDSFRAKDSTQPGFAFGGPIVKDKAFFFANFDGQRQKLPVIVTDIRQSSGFLALTPAVQQQFMTKLETFLGHPYDNELHYDQTFNQQTYMGKVDLNLGTKYRVSIRDNYTNFENGNNQTPGHLSNQGVEHDKFNQLVGQVTMAFTNRMVNEVLIQQSRDERPIDPTSNSTELSIAGLTSSALLFGQLDSLPNNTVEKKTQVKDTLTYVMGNHTLKAGTEMLFMNIDNLFARNSKGVFVYNTPTLYVNEVPNSYRQGYGPGGGLTSWSQNTFAFYGSDSIRFGTRLTADLGLRYDWQTMPKPAANAFPQHPEFITQIKEDKNNVAVRLGAAWDVRGDGKSVLRGGTGTFYGYMPDILLSNPLTQISGNFNQITITCATATTVPCPAAPNVLPPDQFNLLAKTSTDIVTVGPNYQAQQSWRSSMQFEQRVYRDYTAAVGFVVANMKNVQGSQNINAVKTGLMLGNLPLYSVDPNSPARLYTDMGVVRQLFSGETASYRAFTLETHKLALGGSSLSWDLSYTWSRSIDQDSNERSTSSSFLYDPFNPELSEGPSDNDITHRVVGDAVYRLPWDFLVSAIYTWRTGTPYTNGISFTGSGIPGSPNALNGLSGITGNIPVFVNTSGEVIDLLQANNFSRQQFVDFLAGQGATIIGRNTRRQPNWHNFDLRFSKSFRMAHKTRLEILGEIFNVLNTKNELVSTANQAQFRATYTQATDRYTFTKFSTFGLTNSYATSPDPRQYQVAVKFFF